ncbi:MAG: hypothetical protein IIV05_01610 [Ruminococcus sp.]|nr:hypothetical protein [Ruminococcus sp.]
MISIRLDDPHFSENLDALLSMRRMGLYTDEELQEMYDRQLEKDAIADAARKEEAERR